MLLCRVIFSASFRLQSRRLHGSGLDCGHIRFTTRSRPRLNLESPTRGVMRLSLFLSLTVLIISHGKGSAQKNGDGDKAIQPGHIAIVEPLSWPEKLALKFKLRPEIVKAWGESGAQVTLMMRNGYP